MWQGFLQVRLLLCVAVFLAGCATEPTRLEAVYGDTLPTEADIAFIDDWASSAVNSLDEETLAVGVLLAEANALQVSSLDFLQRAQALEASNPSLLVSFITRCGQEESLQGCSFAELSDRLIRLDNDNAFTQVLAAVGFDRQGDEAGALNALELAGQSSSFDDYLIKRSAFLADFLRAIDYPSDYLINHAFFWGGDNFAAVYQDLMLLCEKYVRDDAAWKSACVQLGELMESHGTTFVAVRIGQGIQRSMYSFDPADDRKLQAVQRRRAFTHRWRVLHSEKYQSLLAAGSAQFFQDQIDVNEIFAINQAFQRESGIPDPDSFLNRQGSN